MYSSFRTVYTLCNKVFVRNLRSGRLGSSRPQVGPNPGLDNRLRAFKEEGIPIDQNDAEDFVEGSESDLYGAGEAYSVHTNETLMGKFALRHQIVKEKYFKENMPNLLTWSEKAQIRHLCSEEPDKWNPDTIAESFPVTAAVVKKLIKYPWKPATLERIQRHDASAMRNWRELKEGSLDIPKDLREHFLKFSDRSIPPLNEKSIKKDLTLAKQMGEFERIIERCAAKEESNIHEEDYQQTEEKSLDITHKHKYKDRKQVTLDELTEKIKKRLERGNKLDENDQLLIDYANEESSTVTVQELNSEITLADEKHTSVTESHVEQAIVHVKTYPERIRIPKKAYKRGATYKVDDCYYDHDGRFLYRVIGMTN